MIGIYECDKYILIDTKNNYPYHTKTFAKNLENSMYLWLSKFNYDIILAID